MYNLYQYFKGCTTTLPILAWVYKHYQCCQDVQQPLVMLVGVYNLYQCYQGVQPLSMLSECTTFINIIKVYNIYQYYQGCTTTIINIIRDVKPLSILAGM